MTTTTPQPSAQIESTNENATPTGGFQVVGGIFLLAMWFTFGISTLLNGFAFSGINPDYEEGTRVELPDSSQEMLWLVLGFWGAGYLAGLLAGAWGNRNFTWSQITWSAVLGYETATLCRLLIINTFPVEDGYVQLPTDTYQTLVKLVSLETPHIYISFIFFTLLIGPVLVALGTLGVLAVIREMDLRGVVFPRLDMRALILAAGLPLATLLMLMGLSYVLNPPEVSNNEITSLLPELELIYNPAVNMALAALCGLVIGLSPLIRDRWTGVISASVGIMLHLQIAVMLKALLVAYARLEGYSDPLNLLMVDAVYFSLLWGGTVFVSGATTYAIHILREIFFSPLPPPLTEETSSPEM